MSDNPIKLWPGPLVDGRETYFTLGRDFYPLTGWERRRGDGGQWEWEPWRDDSFGGAYASNWYQVRPPAKLPDPTAMWAGGGQLVVVWAQMKDRTDLHEWEVLVRNGTWVRVDDLDLRPSADNYPIRIRRKEQGR